MKIYLNIHKTTGVRFTGIDKLTESDKLTIICERNSNFNFTLEEVKSLLQAKCGISIVDTENVDSTLDLLIKKSEEKREPILVLNDIDLYDNLKHNAK